MFLRKLILSPQAAFAYSLPSTRSSVLLLNAGLCPFAESEEYAVREKDGIYKPHDHYLEEATEKKQLKELGEHYGFQQQQQFSTEVNNKFERIETLTQIEDAEKLKMELDSKKKQLAGLQDLCCSHEQLSVELREKLERTEKKLEETEHSLSDLKEKHKLVNEENENLKSDLVRSGKAIDKAAEREKEFENTTLYISSVLTRLRTTPNAREKELAMEISRRET